MDVIAGSLMIKGIASVILMALATFAARSAVAAAVGVLIASAGILAFYDWPMSRRVRAEVSQGNHDGIGNALSSVRFSRLCQLGAVALPLGVVQGLVSLSANIPRYQLEARSGLSDLGVFSAMASLIVIGQTIVSALGNVASPRLAQLYAVADGVGFAKLLLRIVCFGAAVGVMAIGVTALCGTQLLSILFRPEYAAHADVLTIVMIGAAFAYIAWLLGFALTAAQLFREQIPVLAAVCGSAWLASRALIPAFGLAGAAMGFAVSMAVQAVGAALILIYAMRRNRAVSHGT
jgi:O-antigen/teichoic acid export membrane protein